MTAGKLKIDIRRKQILEYLRRQGKISVTEVADALNVTPVTIRNDLDVLEQEGCLMRVQGGAVQAPGKTIAFNAEGIGASMHVEEKMAIGTAVAQIVKDGDTLFINSGTTCEYVADALSIRQNLNIVTNSLKVATKLGAVPSFRVVLIGGEINAQYGFTCGGDAQEQLEKYQADWTILSVDGISVKGGITTHHAEEAIIDRIMVMGSKQTLIAADGSKIGRTGFSRVCEASSRLLLVTNRGGDMGAAAELQKSGVRIVFA